MSAAITYAVLIDEMPARPDVVNAIESIEIESNVGLADVCRITFATALSDDGDRWTIVDDGVVDRLSSIRVLVSIGIGLPVVAFDGVVTETNLTLSAEPGVSQFEVLAMDRSIEMNLDEKIRQWPNMPDGVIAGLIFAEYGMIPVVQPTTLVRTQLDTTVTQRDTDIRFLRHLAARNGYDVYVRPGPVPGVVEGHFHPPTLDLPPQGVLSVDMAEATNVESFSARHDLLRATRSTAGGVDARRVSAQQVESSDASESELGRRGTVGAGARTTVLRPSGLNVDNELELTARSTVDRSSWGVSARGELDPSVYGDLLRPAATVLVRGAGSTFSGAYYVEHVTHHVVGERYRQQFTLRRNAVEPIGTEVYLSDGGLLP